MSKRSLFLIVGAVIILALIPWIAATIANHGLLSIPPEFADDSGYYYTQLHDVAQGYPFIGNPYFKEYAHEPATSFFGADWVAAVPFIVGIPVVRSVLIDLVLAFGAFAGLLLMLAWRLGMRGWWGIVPVATSLATSYWLMERPVSMQVVFPLFVFFLLAYLLWLQDYRSRLAQALLIIAAALSFYIYTYLWQIVVIVFGLTHVWLFLHERRRIIQLLWIDAMIAILALPMLWYTYKQLHLPWYWPTIIRTGFVETHTFGSSAVIAALITIPMLAAVWILCKDQVEKRIELTFIGITGISILIACFSNVITGKDLETAIHFIRFTYLWAAIAGSYALFIYFRSRRFERHKDIMRTAGIGVVGIIAFFAFNLYHTLQVFPSAVSPSTLSAQAYAAPLRWLNENTPAGSVVFADDSFSYYVPLMTRDYVLFQPDGGLYLMPDSDVQDRYLASRMLDDLSLTTIEGDLRLYAGAGNADDGPETADRSAKLCELFIRKDCPLELSPVSYMGLPYFTTLYQRYQDMRTDPGASLTHYDVSYIVKDTLRDPDMNLTKLPGTTLVATIGRFELYSFAMTSAAK